MQFDQNTLIRNEKIIDIMESIKDEQFNLVYLDLPWFTGHDKFIFGNSGARESNLEIKKFLSKERICEIEDITLNDIREEIVKRKLKKDANRMNEYGEFISKILENSMRILNNTGILVFRSPAKSVIDYKLMLDQVFPNTYIMQITIEKRKGFHINRSIENMNQEILYLFSKTKEYNLNEIFEDPDTYSSEFNYIDERDRYKLIPLLMRADRKSRVYKWKGITPLEEQSWRYDEERMNELYDDHRIVLKDDRALFKSYMKDNPRRKSTVWKASLGNSYNLKEKRSFTLSANNFIDLLNMVTVKNDWIFSPYDVDIKLPVIAQKMERNWVVINPYTSVNKDKDNDYIDDLLEASYIEINDTESGNQEMVYSEILKDINDINDLKNRLTELDKNVLAIKEQLGISVEDEEKVIEQIHLKIDILIEQSDIERYIPIVQGWIKPFWDSLEPESRQFLPTAELLFQEYKNVEQFDLSIALLSYCKALEKELYSKFFRGYIRKTIDDKINIRKEFPQDFIDKQTRVFAENIDKFTSNYKNNEKEWNFTFGTMVYILRYVFENTNKFLVDGRIYWDFRKYIEEKFDYIIFDIKFMTNLNYLVDLRNASAHPNIINSNKINDGKEVTKKKIVDILNSYNK